MENIKKHRKKFEGIVKKIVKQTATIELKRFIYSKKYERFAKSKTRIYAKIPEELLDKIKLNDLVVVAECKKLSKMKNHIIIKLGEKK